MTRCVDRRTVMLTAGLLLMIPWNTPLASRAPDPAPAPASLPTVAEVLGDHVLLCWNDLGMHCMNRDHANLSVLPPYNNLHAQLIRRGDASRNPELVRSGVELTYSIPGNTYSVGKTDFWTYAPALFGITLPPDVGLTGKGLTGTLDPAGDHFVARGIPVTPFPDATPTIEHAYQQALVIAGDGTGQLATSRPVIPVSVELGCVGAGCHASESEILNSHERVSGFDPNARPILCGGCHADPALGTPGIGEAGYFSFRMHDAHKFLDEQLTGVDVCYRCHPGANARCLRGVMATRFSLVCQDCHGGMLNVAATIEQGRTPWLNEPSCGHCHASQFAEPPGQLFRLSYGHGGVMCEGCHHSTHAEWTSGVAADNENVIALQGMAGPLASCVVCHGVTPTGAGPHGIRATAVAGDLLSGARAMTVMPNPTTGGCSVEFSATTSQPGALAVYDVQGRIVALLRPRSLGGGRMTATWDGRDRRGTRASPGSYFVRWQSGGERAGARITTVK